MTSTTDTTVSKSVVVNVPIEDAFSAFTERFGDFKPREHNLMGSPIAATVFEGKVGGHIYDRAEDGTECHWARVLAYEPPERVVFSWDIGPTWQLETDPELTSEVEVRFTAEDLIGPGSTSSTATSTARSRLGRCARRHRPGVADVLGALRRPARVGVTADRQAERQAERAMPSVSATRNFGAPDS